MNNKGYSDKEFLNVIRIVAGLVLLYLLYIAIKSKFGL